MVKIFENSSLKKKNRKRGPCLNVENLHLAAVLSTITARDTVGDWVKFTMNIQSIFKKPRDNRVRRGLTYFWVRMADLTCKCPKIKINK